jgi:hypothetical protein
MWKAPNLQNTILFVLFFFFFFFWTVFGFSDRRQYFAFLLSDQRVNSLTLIGNHDYRIVADGGDWLAIYPLLHHYTLPHKII